MSIHKLFNEKQYAVLRWQSYLIFNDFEPSESSNYCAQLGRQQIFEINERKVYFTRKLNQIRLEQLS